MNSIRTRIGGVASRLFPQSEEWAFSRQRRKRFDSLMRIGDYETRLLDVKKIELAGHPSHVLVIPQFGPSVENWKPAGGNFFFEIAQSLREFSPNTRASIFDVGLDESPASWHERLLRFCLEHQVTHVIAQIETDPNQPENYSWDVAWALLSQYWDGVFLGVLFDSGFSYITYNAKALGRISDHFVLVDICMPMDGVVRRGRAEVGPINMPISNLTLETLDSELAGIRQIHDVSFVGALYPYRVEMIETLRAHGVDVAVNPHREDVTRDFHESRTNQPTYVDYMRGLAQSKMTINFSVSSSLNGQQLKTRILEGSAMGCLVLTDDVDRSDRFWVPGEEVGYFTAPSDVPALVEAYLADPERLARAQAAGKARARSINVTSFWGGIDAGLARRGLPQIRE